MFTFRVGLPAVLVTVNFTVISAPVTRANPAQSTVLAAVPAAVEQVPKFTLLAVPSTERPLIFLAFAHLEAEAAFPEVASFPSSAVCNPSTFAMVWL